ncbi:hypothetical protein QH494_24120 [Sphingomonas sp. AR_OL41]|uniref:hypothetical protein n=1 Tax=Sphingomonas sp. AR_OL41 TaxID=3042729 RepID=UPI0024803501|nr:hypothetical protein [Sphingomonas sp. AR_OL41]MDH7975284.1 hypothetical protein [Sphingomonas sp. AR_OL41]
MDTPTFLAWSLLVAGVLAAAFLSLRRVAVAKGVPQLTLPVAQRVTAVFILLLASALATKVSNDIRDVALPAWTHLVFGTTSLTLGLFYRSYSKVGGTGFASSRVPGYMLMAMGALILALEIADMARGAAA